MEKYSSETSCALLALSHDLAAMVEKVGSVVVAVNARHRIPSSGVCWQPGIIVTAAHTIRRHEEITVTLPNNRTLPASVGGYDLSTDLAILKIGEFVGLGERPSRYHHRS